MIKLPVTANITASLPMAHALPSLAYKNSVLSRQTDSLLPSDFEAPHPQEKNKSLEHNVL